MKPDFDRLTKKKIVVVTGATRGIGRAIAEKFADYGYLVVLNGRNKHDLMLAADAIEANGLPCVTAPGDIADIKVARGIFRSLEALSKEHGYANPVDILINNAGISHIGLLQDMTPEEWMRILGTNLTGVYNTCHEAIPYMVKAKAGRIINISSVWGNVGASCEAAYSATKGGVNALTKALAKELAPSGIAVNALACGLIRTGMNASFSEEEWNAIIEEIPAGRAGEPAEVADFCLKLAAASPYLTGQIIGFDGGWM